jgi:hypothetical protein
VAYSYDVGPVVIRHRDFLPFCYLDPQARGRPMLTHDHRISYTLDLQALYSPAGMRALYSDTGGQGILIGDTHQGGLPEGTLQGALTLGQNSNSNPFYFGGVFL